MKIEIDTDKVLAELELEASEVSKIYSEEFTDGYKAALWDLHLIFKDRFQEYLKENPPFSGPYK